MEVKIIKSVGITIGLSSLLGLLVGCPISSISQCSGYVQYAADSGFSSDSSPINGAWGIGSGFVVGYSLKNSNPGFCPTSAATFSIVDKSPKPDWVRSSAIGSDGHFSVQAHTIRFNASGQQIFPLETNKPYNMSVLITTPTFGSLSLDFVFAFGSTYPNTPFLATPGIPKIGISSISLSNMPDYGNIESLSPDFFLSYCNRIPVGSTFVTCNITVKPTAPVGTTTLVIRFSSGSGSTFRVRDQEFYPFKIQ
jgi:hypothetical protein